MERAAASYCAAWLLGLVLCLAATTPAFAANYVSIGPAAAVMYDAPSDRANKLYVASHGYPLDAVVKLEHWTKVRDMTGQLAWVKNSDLSDQHTVVVNVAAADVRNAALDSAPVVFQAAQNVVLDVINDNPPAGWLHVSIAGGQSGYIKSGMVWGAQ
jgi:SH3-like domain-containing protein